MENYQCELCFLRYENPIQCLKCNIVFCKKHMNSDNICPRCKCFPFNFKEKTINSNLNQDSKYKCVVCRDVFGEDKNAFLIHIIYNHKNEMISLFNQNNKAKNQLNVKSINNYNSENQSIDINSSHKNNPKQLVPRSHRNSRYAKNNNQGQMKISINQNKDMNNNIGGSIQIKEKIINNNINNNIYYCGKINDIIKCECCPDHICKEGNCLCVNCMKINCIEKNLSKDKLINRAGRIAKLYKGSFFCGKEYESIIDNSIINRQFNNYKKCEYPSEPCKDCKVLTEMSPIYCNYIQ